MRVARRLRNLLLLFVILGIFLSIIPSSANNNLSEEYDKLFLIVTVLSVIVAIGVVALWIYFMKKFAEGTDVERVPLSHEKSRRLELGWTLTAIVIVIILMVVSYPVLLELDDNTSNLVVDREVYVQAGEYSWKFTYQNDSMLWETTTGSSSSNPILKAGLSYKFTVTSTGQFIHSFFVPDLRFKVDAIPGENNTIVIFIDDPGEYKISCAEYCGAGHSEMRFNKLIVNP